MRGKWIKNVFLIIFIIALFSGIAMTNGKPRRATLVESIFSNIVTLPERMYVYAKNKITGNYKFFDDLEELKKDNENLRNKLQELENSVLDNNALHAENQTLKSHINLSDNYPDYKVIVADIISRSVTAWEATYIINAGEKQGITAGMTVIAKDGLVGIVNSVTDNTAKVISILDAGNSISARVTRTRDEVVCRGTMSLLENNEMKIMNIPLDIALIEGDKIETSGMGGVYPKGISIGKVTKTIDKKNPLEDEAIIKTYVDFDKLETVAVIADE